MHYFPTGLSSELTQGAHEERREIKQNNKQIKVPAGKGIPVSKNKEVTLW